MDDTGDVSQSEVRDKANLSRPKLAHLISISTPVSPIHAIQFIYHFNNNIITIQHYVYIITFQLFDACFTLCVGLTLAS